MGIAIVGAGLSGSVIACELANAGHTFEIFDTRNHISGNCHSERDCRTNVMLDVYDPHISHTDDSEFWAYVTNLKIFYRILTASKQYLMGQFTLFL